MISKNDISQSRKYLKKNLKRKWTQVKVNTFKLDKLILLTEFPEWHLLKGTMHIASGEYGGRVMVRIQKKIIQCGGTA